MLRNLGACTSKREMLIWYAPFHSTSQQTEQSHRVLAIFRGDRFGVGLPGLRLGELYCLIPWRKNPLKYRSGTCPFSICRLISRIRLPDEMDPCIQHLEIDWSQTLLERIHAPDIWHSSAYGPQSRTRSRQSQTTHLMHRCVRPSGKSNLRHFSLPLLRVSGEGNCILIAHHLLGVPPLNYSKTVLSAKLMASQHLHSFVPGSGVNSQILRWQD